MSMTVPDPSSDPAGNVLDTLAHYGVVPVLAIDAVETALPLADALLAGGLPVAEVTFRTAAAAEVLRLLARERPQLLLGAGTVLNTENLDAAIQCGARFALAPGLNPAVVARAREAGLPFLPGVATPTDIEAALGLGCSLLKFFPSEAMGGISMLRALSGPYKHTGVRFVPTGGVNAANLAAYLSTEGVAAVGGTWIATKGDLAEGNWSAITERCRKVREVVGAVRGTG